MVRQKTPVVKPTAYQRIQPRPVKPTPPPPVGKAGTAAVAGGFDASTAVFLRSSNNNAVGEDDRTEELDGARLDDQVDHLETAASDMLEHDDAFDYEDPFELELNAVESGKEFAADPEELAPQADDKTSTDYVEQISDRVATKLADMLLPSLDEMRSNIAKLVEMLSTNTSLPSLKPSHVQRPAVVKAKKDSSHYSHASFAKIKTAPLLSSASSKFPPPMDDQTKSRAASTSSSTDQSSASSVAANSADEATTTSSFPSIDKNLSYLKINSIFHKSHSIQNFATNLLLHLFDIAELTQNVNVNGRVMNGKTAKNALDEKRINIIRQIVEEKAEYDEQVWPSCVNAMNKKISAIKKHKRSR